MKMDDRICKRGAAGTCCPLPIGPATSSKPRPLYKYHVFSSLTILHTSHPAYEDGTDRVFRNVGIQQSDAGEIPKRIHTRLFINLQRPAGYTLAQ